MKQQLVTYDDLFVGMRACFSKTIGQEDIDHFIAITGDVNPLHVDPDFAGRTFFKKPIAHGLLTASMFSHVVGMLLPGTGAIYRSQTVEFLRPVYPGDTVTACLEITRIDREHELIEMNARIHNQAGEDVIRGQASATLLRYLQDTPD